MKFNVVYSDLSEPTPHRPELVQNNYLVDFSREEIAGYDVYIYWNSYSYKPNKTIAKNKIKILLLSEPISVHPIQYSRFVWSKFDYILTWNKKLIGSKIINIDLAYTVNVGQIKVFNEEELLKRKRAICMINNNLYSLMPGQLYSKRREIGKWFNDNGTIPFDIYGKVPFNLPNFKGGHPVVDGRQLNKFELLSQYRFSLCFENIHDSTWSNGYLTEKMFDSLYSLTYPIYLGCSNLDEMLPQKLYIPFDDFSNYDELNRFLTAMSDKEYLDWAEFTLKWLKENKPIEKYSWVSIISKVKNTIENKATKELSIAPFPKDFPQQSKKLSEISIFYLSSFLLLFRKHLKHLFTTFSLIKNFLKRN